MNFLAIFLLVGIVGIFPALWVGLVLRSPLIRLVNPSFRQDLAVTPIQAGPFLAKELRTRLWVAAAPSIVWFVGLSLLALLFAFQGGGGEWSPPDPVVLSTYAVLTFPPILSALGGFGSLLGTSARGCRRGEQFNPTTAILRSFAASIGWLLLLGSVLIATMYLLRHSIASVRAAFLAVEVIACIAAAGTARMRWRALVSEYLVIGRSRP